ncbi:hypothetical protein EST38_g13740 [Candolleomyces aberdarensis]|uniref:DUF803-domain-containing protein n=1 Tax=Candolleomyces aberdarensis TaxID=2316362 RepID=A0A4Q2CZ66_9AGAR|nr:hypothetical protein EST38_g13740 [Candolleomyces aberdarensis]
MVEDKYIGLALAVSSSLAIGTSFIITKKGLNEAANKSAYGQQASDNLAYLKSPIWWAGMTTLVIGEVANFAAYTFAPPILVTPLGALSVIIGAILASVFLKEHLGHLGRLGCTLCLLGSLIIVLHAPSDKDINSVEEFLLFAVQPGFLMYCFTVLVFSLIMIYFFVPKYGKTNPLVYISICSLVGSVSVMAIKGFGIAVKLTFSGHNQFTHFSTYLFGATVAGCIIVQMNYFNKALDTFSTNVVNPMYYVGFSTATLVASIILFQGFNTDDTANAVSLLTGFVVTFLGVHLLNLSRTPEPPIDHDHGPPHSALEGGLMHPRLSLQGRMSIDGWAGVGVSPGGPRSAHHGRQSSLYRSQTDTLFNAFDEHERGTNGDSVGLRNLREEEDEESDDDDLALEYDERSQLRSKGKGSISQQQQQQPHRGPTRNGSRSHSHSPIPGTPSDVRIAGR